MIFEDFRDEDKSGEASEHGPGRRRRRRRSSSAGEGSGRRRRRRSGFDAATMLPDRPSATSANNTRLWVGVLVLLVVAALGFGWGMNLRQSSYAPLAGVSPTSTLHPFVDPILAPLETGMAGCPQGALAEVEARFQARRAEVAPENQEVCRLGGVVARLMSDAEADRIKHLERLAELEKQSPTELPQYKREQFTSAISTSWRSNSAEYRNRLEELWVRLSALETGKFGTTPTLLAPESQDQRQ